MALSVADFWRLVLESQLLTAAQCRDYGERFGRVKGASVGATAATLAEWLIAENIISRYQGVVLLAGKAGPFVYGDYRVYDRVESGRLVGTFRAVHAETGHPVMLAFLPSAVTGDANRWAHTVRMSQTLAPLANPHLRRCHDLVDLGKYRFLVLEDVRGATLADSLAPGRAVPPGDAVRAIRQAALGMASLHAVGITHGRVTPRGLWLTDTGHVKVLLDPTIRSAAVDFSPGDADQNLTELSDYLAPELFHAGRTPNAATDVYGLGATFYQLLAGRPPFPGGTLREKAARHASEPIVPLEYSGVPPQLAHAAAYMLAKDANVRLPNAASVADALAPFVDPAAPAPKIPATAAAYDRWLVEHQAARSRRAAEAATPTVAAAEAPRPTISIDLSAPAEGRASVAAARLPARGRSKSSMWVAVGVAGVLAVVLGVVAMNAMNGDDGDQPQASTAGAGSSKDNSRRPRSKPNSTPGAETPKVNEKPPVVATNINTTPVDTNPMPTVDPDKPPAPKAPEAREEKIEDDGKTLWASPTSGPPLDARLVGLGAQAMLVIRPADLAASEEGKRVLAAMGPAGAALRTAVESASGIAFDEIAQASVVLYPDGEPPQASYIIRLAAPMQEAALAKNWKNATASKFEGKKLFASETTAYYLPAWGEGRVFAAGPIPVVQEIVKQDERPGTFGPLVDQLLASSDSDRHATFVATPQFLFGDGRTLFSGPAQRLREPLAEFVGDNVRALSISMHVDDDDCFGELRVLGAVEQKPEEFATRYADRVKKLSELIESAQVGVSFSPYGERTLRRFPRMMEEVALNLRWGVDDGQALLRCYLPGRAAHNLAQAIELAVHETGGAAAVAAAPAETKPAGVAERLAKKISMTFAREPLDKTLEIWSAETGLKVVMLGTDMMAEGITKNQPISDFDQKDQPAEAVLLAVLKIASPQGKLVYVVKPEAPGGPDIIQITTRAAAATRKDKLPASLAAPAETPKKK